MVAFERRATRSLPARYISRSFTAVLAVASAWILVTGKAFGPLEFPRPSAFCMLVFFCVLLTEDVSSGAEVSRERPIVRAALLGLFIASLVLAVASG
jgi:hypothetical protein